MLYEHPRKRSAALKAIVKMMAIEGVRGDLRGGMERSDEAALAGLIVSFVLRVGVALLGRYGELYGGSARPI